MFVSVCVIRIRGVSSPTAAPVVSSSRLLARPPPVEQDPTTLQADCKQVAAECRRAGTRTFQEIKPSLTCDSIQLIFQLCTFLHNLVKCTCSMNSVQVTLHSCMVFQWCWFLKIRPRSYLVYESRVRVCVYVPVTRAKHRAEGHSSSSITHIQDGGTGFDLG